MSLMENSILVVGTANQIMVGSESYSGAALHESTRRAHEFVWVTLTDLGGLMRVMESKSIIYTTFTILP